jgi:hypothetical protein
MKEFALRDHLAANLSMIEPGLVLLGKEHYLRNNDGTSGFVDILAKDSAGRLVVIEIKVDKSSEREAITELMKYVALLRNSTGRRYSELRLIVVSTDWRELLTPLSEFSHNTDYNVHALRAIVQPCGTVNLSPVVLHGETSERRFANHHWIQIYEAASERDKRREEFIHRVRSRGIRNFIVADIIIDNGFAVLPSFYFAQQLEPIGFFEGIVKVRGDEVLEELQECYVDGEDYWQVLAGAAYDGLSVPADELEISNPEKFKGWHEAGVYKFERIHRFGSFFEDQLLTEEQVIFELGGFDGNASSWFMAACKPGDRARAAEIKRNFVGCVAYNDRWRQLIGDAIDVAHDSASMHLSLSIFNPENIIESIGNFVREGDSSYLPSFTIVMEDASSSLARVFRGFVESTGTLPASDIKAIIEQEFGDIFCFLMVSTTGGVSESNERMMDRLGLRYSVTCEEYQAGCTVPKVIFDAKIRAGVPKGFDQPSGVAVSEWVKQNPTIVAQALDIYENHVIRVQPQ